MAKSPNVVATSLGATVYGDPPCSPSSGRVAGFPSYRFAFLALFSTCLNVEHVVYVSLALVFYFISFCASFVATTAAVWGFGSVVCHQSYR